MKKYEKIVNIILMALLMSTFLVIFAPVTQAAGGNTGDIVSEAGEFINVGKNENSPINENALKPGSRTLYNVLLAIGIAVALIWGLVLGVQFVTGSLEDKADIKKGLIPYIIGCVIIFGAFDIWRLVINLLEPLSK